MLLRLIVIALALAFAVVSLKRWTKRLSASSLGDLTPEQLAEVTAMAARVKPLADALEVRRKVLEILRDERATAELGAEVSQQVDRAIWELARQHRTRERIGGALGALDLNGLADAEAAATESIGDARGEDARAEARRTLERVTLQRQQVEQLGRRSRELESAGGQILLDLQNLHLALLDAASSRAGLTAEPVRTLREKLAEATRDVAMAAHAEEEVDRAIAAATGARGATEG